MMKSKIHRVRVTQADLHYEGSCGIDKDLIKAAKLVPHEHIHIWNITRGTRFETYVLEAPAGSGTIQVNGAAAHHAHEGDLIIISSFGYYSAAEAKKHKPVVVFVDKNNKAREIARKSGRPDKLPVR